MSTDAFTCGVELLDDWLKKRALESNRRGNARVLVSLDAERAIAGYFALSAGAIERSEVSGALTRNAPNSIPVILLGRLAVHVAAQGSGLGRSLLRDAVLRALQAANHIGAPAMLLHAVSDDAKAFYERFGFKPTKTDPYALIRKLSDLEAALRS